MKSSRFHMKSGGFHKIWQISHEIRWISQNPADFTKSSRFHMKSSGFHKIWWISCEIWWISQNPADFMWNLVDFIKSCRFHVKSTDKTYKSNISRKTLQFYGVLWEGYVMFSHEICWISHEICRISKDQLPGMVSPMFYPFSIYLNQNK